MLKQELNSDKVNREIVVIVELEGCRMGKGWSKHADFMGWLRLVLSGGAFSLSIEVMLEVGKECGEQTFMVPKLQGVEFLVGKLKSLCGYYWGAWCLGVI